MKYRVEFNTTGFYAGAGIWEVLDETCDIEADSPEEAISLVKAWWIETSDDPEAEAEKINQWAWAATSDMENYFYED